MDESQLVHDALKLQVALPISFKAVLAFTQDDQLMLIEESSGRSQVRFIDPKNASLAFQEQSLDSGWIERTTVRYGQTLKHKWVAQFYPPQKMQLTLQIDSQFCPDECADADTVEVTVPFPSLLFLAIGGSAYLWAMKRRSFNPQSKLYHVPLPNVDTQGLLCFGVNSKPEASVETVRQIWETWWSGIFNRDNVSGKSKAHPIDIREQIWAQRGQKGYPTKDLVKCDQDAGSAIERLIRH